MNPYEDAVLLEYIKGFHQATDDHQRAMYGAFMVGYIEATIVMAVENHEREQAERKEE